MRIFADRNEPITFLFILSVGLLDISNYGIKKIFTKLLKSTESFAIIYTKLTIAPFPVGLGTILNQKSPMR